ncbi:O-methyltransferase [Reichenbachiella agarivorans]|uniref:O-methyltransferase n=1 Tax=Reichenbachiella agarivorans TaxID=2979464 RepID=A0ABY6CMF9_9BACT|nr:O-methyltransferase [Reichenbachiella agarivorans]UXP31255.1 O-methyltransferase [Reichenbachiella agarivorans]
MDFLDREIQRYTEGHSSAATPLLERIDRETHLEVMMPRMISGHVQGRILSMFSYMIRPRRILEIGTYTGYSALCLAEGMTVDGRLITVDVNEELEDRVRGYIAASDYAHQIDYYIGKGAELIPTLDETFDLVFIDADKSNYQTYFDLVLPKMRKGGFILADNVLWSGKVVEQVKPNDKDTLALIDFNKSVHDDPRVENVLMPVRDGLMILRVL